MSFLRAEWRKLAIANYAVDEQLLHPYLPPKTVIDKWNGTTYVSLVGFMFQNTKVLGMKIPFHINFEEVNLRFYVKHKDGNEWKRGVVFIKEIVPKHAITLIANTFYKEHYQTLKMKHSWITEADSRMVKYEWKYNNQWQSFSLNAELNPSEIMPESEPEFITEHYWGYTKINDNTTFEYGVTHPSWQHYLVKEYDINVDYGLVYGKDFELLNNLKPTSVILAEGSEITVENKRKI
jgi:uncharacterized protein YqjF (DUF2071 family)